MDAVIQLFHFSCGVIGKFNNSEASVPFPGQSQSTNPTCHRPGQRGVGKEGGPWARVVQNRELLSMLLSRISFHVAFCFKLLSTDLNFLIFATHFWIYFQHSKTWGSHNSTPPQNICWKRPHCCLMLLHPRPLCPFSISSLQQLHCASQGGVWEGHGRTAGHRQFPADKPKAYWWAQQEKMGGFTRFPCFNTPQHNCSLQVGESILPHIINRD